MWNSALNANKTKAEILSGVESPVKASKKVAANTVYMEYQNGNAAYRYHETDVVTIKPNGNIVLNSGGWRTHTTKARINRFSPVFVHTNKGTWYANGNVFYDGMEFDSQGELVSTPIEDPTKQNEKVKRAVREFLKTLDNGIPKPGAGDCWICAFGFGTDCLEQHLNDGYLHGSLVVRAMEWAGYNNQSIGMAVNGYFPVDILKGIVRRFMLKHIIKDIQV